MYLFKEIELNENLEARMSLTKIFGIGKSRANFVFDSIGISNSVQLKDVSYYNYLKAVFLIRTYYITEIVLKQKLQMDLQLLLNTEDSYRCIRYKLFLPLRGQKTRANAQTWKRRRRGSVKKKVARGKRR
jgi:small subunit ribosomal protein S13